MIGDVSGMGVLVFSNMIVSSGPGLEYKNLAHFMICSDISAPLLPLYGSNLFYQRGVAPQALAVILYMSNQEVPFARSASSVCCFC